MAERVPRKYYSSAPLPPLLDVMTSFDPRESQFSRGLASEAAEPESETVALFTGPVRWDEGGWSVLVGP